MFCLCLCLCLCPCIRLCVRLCRCLGHHQMNPDAVLLPAIYDMWVAMLKSHKCGCLLRIRLQREEEGEGKSHSKVGSRWVRQRPTFNHFHKFLYIFIHFDPFLSAASASASSPTSAPSSAAPASVSLACTGRNAQSINQSKKYT